MAGLERTLHRDYYFSEEIFRREQLPRQGATPDPEWFARITENKGLTISNYEPLVAVGRTRAAAPRESQT